MTRVSNADHVLLLLRERLQHMDRTRSGRAARPGSAQKGTQRPLLRLHETGAFDQLSDEDFRRTLVRAVLTEKLGDAVANDPGFQAVVEDVFRILSDSGDGRELMDRAARQLRPPPA